MNGFSHSHYSVPGMFFHHHLPTCCSPAAFDHSQLQEAGAGKGTKVNFSSHQRNLIKTFQIEGMIALITKMILIFSSDLLNGQK